MGLRWIWSIVFALSVGSAVSCAARNALDHQGRARFATPQGNVIRVGARDNLQRALDEAKCGDTIVLETGATFTAPADQGFVFPGKRDATCNGTAADTITIRTAAIEKLPAAGERVGIRDAAQMARLVTAGPHPAISFGAHSRFWKLIGLELTTTPAPQYVSFVVYVGVNLKLDQLPADITFDRCYIHSQEDGSDNAHATSRGGVEVEAMRVNFTGCRVAFPGGYAGSSKSTDATYAILTVAGPGPIAIDNCFLNSWFAIFFMGGGGLWTRNTATVSPGATMTRAELSNTSNLAAGDLIALQTRQDYYEVARVTGVNGNTINYEPWAGNLKPGLPLHSPPISPGGARWDGLNPGKVRITHSTFHINPVIANQIFTEIGSFPKGFFEIKSADGLDFEGNEFTGWPATLVITVRNQTGPSGAPSPWSTIRNVTFKNNRYANLSRPYGAQLFGIQLEDNIGTSQIGGNILIENNLFTTGGWMGDLIGGREIVFRHNTIINNGTGWEGGRTANGVFPVSGLAILDNIVFNNEYGMSCQAPYAQTWTTCWPDLQMRGNVLISRRTDPYRPNCKNSYPPGNSCPTSETEVRFVDTANGNYRLAANSPYKGKASDGTDPGANLDAIEKAIKDH
jgi:hypothetical protein